MAKVGDLRVQNDVWEAYTDWLRWEPIPADFQAYYKRNFAGISGTGTDQRLVGRGEFAGSISRQEAAAGLSEAVAAGTVGAAAAPTQPPTTGAATQGQRIANAYCTWINVDCATMSEEEKAKVWPPMINDITRPIFGLHPTEKDKDGNPIRTVIGHHQIQDSEAVKQFLSYTKQNDITFTDFDPPATWTGTGTPKSVDIGGQQYFQQPDGTFERVP